MIDIYDVTHADEVMRPVRGGKANTLQGRMGTGGGQVQVIHEYEIAGNIIDRKPGNGENGNGFQEGVSYTLNTIDRHAVCIGNGQANQKTGEVTGALNCMHDQQAAFDCGTVRRLTPLECERLQGLPEIRRFVIFDFENERICCKSCRVENSHARFEDGQWERILKHAGNAENIELKEFVLYAERNSNIKFPLTDKHVPLSVHINLEGSEAATRNSEGQSKNAKNVEKSSELLQARKINNFVQMLVLTNTILEKNPHRGVVELQKEESTTTKYEENGIRQLRKYGKETWECVKDADANMTLEKIKEDLLSITSNHIGRQKEILIWKTWFSYVQNAMLGYTQGKMSPMIIFKLNEGYTFGGSDTARYKAIGNGMAQPCADFILRRIEEEAGDSI